MKNLTKENFWNEMHQKYPEQMKRFCAWIDKYKARVNWNILFNHQLYGKQYKHSKTSMKQIPAPKYHDLPLAMQMGIFMEFCGEYKLDECKAEIESVFNIDRVLNEMN